MIHNRKRELYVLRLNFESILDFYCVHQESHKVDLGGFLIMNNRKSVLRCGLCAAQTRVATPRLATPRPQLQYSNQHEAEYIDGGVRIL